MANFETLVEPLLIIVVLVAIALGVMLYALRRLKVRMQRSCSLNFRNLLNWWRI